MSQKKFVFDSSVISQMKYFQYRIIASHMFRWINLPPGLNSENMELMLIDRGSVCFFNTTAGHYVLPYSFSGLLDVYGNPTDATAMTINGEQLDQIDTIPRILWDNSVRNTFDGYLRSFADRLAHIQMSIAIAERQARFPTIVKVNETNKESWGRFQTKVDEGYPVIFVDENMNEEAVGVMDTGFRAEIFTALWNDYNKVEGEIYSLLGTMFNVEQNKAAGVGTAETIVNYAQTFAFANARLHQRQRWCEKLNAEFDLGIWCDKHNDFQDIVAEMLNSNTRNPQDIINSTEEIKNGEESHES
jgi:hypothetical protein